MGKYINWYLDGWKRSKEPDKNGKLHTVWHYHGVYYSYHMEEKKLSRLKTEEIGLAAGITVLWFLLAVFGGVGKDAVFYVGAPWFLCIIPLMELLCGAWGMRSASNRMTYRDMYAGYRRLKYGLCVLLPLQGITVLGEILFLILYGAQIRLLRELVWFAFAILCTAASGFLMKKIHSCKPWQLPED